MINAPENDPLKANCRICLQLRPVSNGVCRSCEVFASKMLRREANVAEWVGPGITVKEAHAMMDTKESPMSIETVYRMIWVGRLRAKRRIGSSVKRGQWIVDKGSVLEILSTA